MRKTKKSPNAFHGPTLVEQQAIHQKVAALYKLKRTPTQIVEETGYGVNTVYKHYNQILEGARKNALDEGFIQLQKMAKEDFLRGADERIGLCQKSLAAVTERIWGTEAKPRKKPDLRYLPMYHMVLRDLNNFEDIKGRLMMAPTADIEMEQILLKEYKSLVSNRKLST